MKEYNLIFPFSKTGEVTLVRTMPDGQHKGQLNGIGGRTNGEDPYGEKQAALFFDTDDSEIITSRHVMDVTFQNGCTDDSKDEPILLHVIGHVYHHLKKADVSAEHPKADQVEYIATYDGMMHALEKRVDEYADAVPVRRYVNGYEYFLSETIEVMQEYFVR